MIKAGDFFSETQEAAMLNAGINCAKALNDMDKVEDMGTSQTFNMYQINGDVGQIDSKEAETIYLDSKKNIKSDYYDDPRLAELSETQVSLLYDQQSSGGDMGQLLDQMVGKLPTPPDEDELED